MSKQTLSKHTLSIDEAITALQKAKEVLGNDPSAVLVLVLPTHGLAVNVVDLVANQEDGSVRVAVRL